MDGEQPLEFTELVDGSHKYTHVMCDPMLGPGGAHHFYRIKNKDGESLLTLKFQNGPIGEVGVNGIMNEDLLAILIDRFKGFQAGPYACEENEAALVFIDQALKVMKRRTKEREERGVEGTHKI